MIRRIVIFILITCIYSTVLAQKKATYNIGILLDIKTKELKPAIAKLQNEIKAVVGEDAIINFPEESLLTNNFNLQKATQNYQTLLNNNTDIILAFGAINNVVVTKQKTYKKPTILFGAVNNDVIAIDKNKETSGVNNFTYLISSQSYKKDLQTFKKLYNFKNIGIVVENFLPDLFPLKELFDKEIKTLKTSYKLIPFKTVADIKNNLATVDAVYMAGGFLLDATEIKELAQTFIAHKLPSFTSTDIKDVINGIMATNQSKGNTNRFFRRIALNIERIVNGTNASKLPIYIDFHNNLTLNYNTAEQVDVPIKYSLISTTNLVGDFNNVLSQKKYTLLAVIKETLTKNLRLQSEKKNIDIKNQDVKTAKSNYYPTVSATATGTYTDPKLAEISGGQNPEYKTNGAISLNQTLYSEKASANIAIQKNLKKAQQETYNATELDAILNASTAYFNALILKTNLKIQAQNLDVTKKNLQIAEQNYEAGQSGKTDVLRFKSEQAQNTQTLVEAANQLEQAFYNLNQLLNNTIDYEIDIDDAELNEGVFKNYSYKKLGKLIDDPTLRKHFVAFLIEEAKNLAPELKVLDYNLKATKRSLKLNSSGRFVPTLGLQGQYNQNFNQWGKGSTPIPTLDNNYSVGLNLTIPIFQQNQQNINKQTAIIQQDQLTINKENTALTIEKNINDAVLTMINQIANIELSQVSEETAKESLDLTQASYLSGAVTITQLIDAQRNYLQAQLSKTTATYNYLLSSMQLERYLGYYFLLHTEAENQDFIQRFNEFRLKRN